jgi:hypothetical protein
MRGDLVGEKAYFTRLASIVALGAFEISWLARLTWIA